MKEFSVTPDEVDLELFESLERQSGIGGKWFTLGYMRAHQRVTFTLLRNPEFRGREIEAVLFALDHPELPIVQIREIFRNGTDEAWNAEWGEIQHLIANDAPSPQQDMATTASSAKAED